MTPQEQMEIEWLCTKLINEFAHSMDSRNYARLVDQFAPDGVFDRVGQVLKGREAILEALNKRSMDIRTRHCCVNILFSDVTPTSAKARIYCVNFVGKGDPVGQPVPYGMSQAAVLTFEDSYVKTGEGWKIAERLAMPMIMPPEAAH